MRKTVLVVAVVAALLAFSAPAFAQSSIDGYSNEAGQVQGGVESNGNTPSGTTPVSAQDTGGALPFTGLDLALLAAAGGVLAAGGVAMRRLTRAPGSA
jgi:hypothetical protein